jgi:hypothetical protein
MQNEKCGTRNVQFIIPRSAFRIFSLSLRLKILKVFQNEVGHHLIHMFRL